MSGNAARQDYGSRMFPPVVMVWVVVEEEAAAGRWSGNFGLLVDSHMSHSVSSR